MVQKQVRSCSDRVEKSPVRILVLGDRTGRPDDEIFKSALREGARLKPDLILGVGDLIEGYQTDEKIGEAEAEWDRVFEMIRRFFGAKPFFSAAGNHDVWSEKSEQLFEKKLGHGVNFAFDVGKARVIVLDSSRIREEADFPEKDLDWLWRELRAAVNHAVRIVVTHVPLWAVGSGGAYGSKLHDVLVAGSADWVLTGHWHHAMSDDRDGIRYRMIGPSGTFPNRPGHPESGNFPQFGLLTVDENGAELSLIEVGSVMSSYSIPYELNQLEWNIENRAIEYQGFELDPLRPATRGRLSATITNVTEEKIDLKVLFEGGSIGWRIRPSSLRVSLNPGESKKTVVSFSNPSLGPVFPGPRAILKLPWPGGGFYTLEKSLSPTLVRRLSESKRAAIMDGYLTEHAWIQGTELGPLTQTFGPEIPGGFVVRALIAQEALYLGVRLEEPDMQGQTSSHNVENVFFEDEDHVAILVDPGPADGTCLKIAVNSANKSYVSLVNVDDGYAKLLAAGLAFESEVRRHEDYWTVEIRIPLSELGIQRSETLQGLVLPFNFGRSRMRDNVLSQAYWQPLREHDLPSFGRLILR